MNTSSHVHCNDARVLAERLFVETELNLHPPKDIRLSPEVLAFLANQGIVGPNFRSGFCGSCECKCTLLGPI